MVSTTDNPTSSISTFQHQVTEFDGTNDYIEVPYSATINPEQFTVSCWAKVTGGQGSYRSPVTSRNSSGSNRQGYMFYAGSNNKWQMWVGNAGDWKVATTEVDVVLNTWTHLAGTYDGSKVNFYINGELAAELSTSFTVNTTYPLRIGAGASERSDPSNSYLFPGQVAEVRLWNQGRTLEEISADLNYRLTGQESGLVGYWALNKTDSDTQQVQDLSSNSNHGTIEGEATIVDDSDDIPLRNRVAEFDGTNDYIEVPYSATINPEQFTVSCWAKVTGGQGSYRSPVTSRNSSGSARQGYMFYATSNNKWQMWVGNAGDWKVATTEVDVVLNTWTHLAGTYDGSKVNFYINGELAAELSTSFTVNTTYPLRIGAGASERSDPSNSYLFPGQVAEVRLWNQGRTLEEISADMNYRLTGQESGLVGYWALNKTDSDTQQVQDLSSNSNHGTIEGEATIVDDSELPID